MMADPSPSTSHIGTNVSSIITTMFDSSSLQITTFKLNDTNYLHWAQAIIMVFSKANKKNHYLKDDSLVDNHYGS